jgi:hypothetical protein
MQYYVFSAFLTAFLNNLSRFLSANTKSVLLELEMRKLTELFKTRSRPDRS